jgi:uncharacterized cupredoxin-like copper-binding protein
MTPKRLRHLVPVVLAAVAAVVIVGCGGGGSETTSQSEPSGKTGTGGSTKKESEEGSAIAGAGTEATRTLTVKMTDYAFNPKNPTIKAGTTTIEAVNEGKVEHELVIFQGKNPANLPTEPNGGVDEEKLDKMVGETGEIPEVQAGETKSAKFELKPGKYVVFCNVPGHYVAGMYGTLTVTG